MASLVWGSAWHGSLYHSAHEHGARQRADLGVNPSSERAQGCPLWQIIHLLWNLTSVLQSKDGGDPCLQGLLGGFSDIRSLNHAMADTAVMADRWLLLR